jgi:glycosyl transferase family 92
LKLVLHAGTHKMGTSRMQKVPSDNRAWLWGRDLHHVLVRSFAGIYPGELAQVPGGYGSSIPGATRLMSWRAWLVYLGLIGLGLMAIALAIQGSWFLAAGGISTAIILGVVLALRAARVEQRNALAEQVKALEKVEKQIAGIEKEGALQREVLEGKLWGLPIPLPAMNQGKCAGYLSAVVIVKDEGPYLQEWLEFHRLVGVQHVYLYDNGSFDGTEQVLSDFIRSGYVTRIPWSSFVRDGSPQKLAYAHALSNFGLAWRWMTLIDADEFLFPTESDNLPSVLTRFEHLPALAVYWRTFGFSGHEKRPSGLVIENFTMRAPFPPEPGVKRYLLKFKSIVDPSKVSAVVSPHMVKLENGLIGACTENGILVPSGDEHRERVSNGHLRINHYYTKSKEELEQKLSRGSGAGIPLSKKRSIASKRAALVEMDLIEDKSIQRFLPKLRRRIVLYPAGEQFDGTTPEARTSLTESGTH